MKLYLDNCCYNRPFDDQTQLKIHLESEAKLHIQQCIRDEKYHLVWSYILEYENMKNPYDTRRQAIIPWKSIADEYVTASDKIVAFAELLAGKGIKTYDALHLACAVSADCDYFLTTDKKLLNTPIPEIKIRNPIDFIREMEE